MKDTSPVSLRQIYERCDVSNNGTVNPMGYSEFEQAIHAYIEWLVETAKPNRKSGIQTYTDKDGEEYDTCKECGGYDECDCEGFNEAIDEYEQAIKTVLKGGK